LSDYYYSKGIILDSKSNKSGSIECYEKAINYNPYNLKAFKNLISMYDSQANTIKANELRLKVENLISKIARINKQ
jgi:tetratricopeptide (TPR) repeat protein